MLPVSAAMATLRTQESSLNTDMPDPGQCLQMERKMGPRLKQTKKWTRQIFRAPLLTCRPSKGEHAKTPYSKFVIAGESVITTDIGRGSKSNRAVRKPTMGKREGLRLLAWGSSRQAYEKSVF